MIPKEILTYSEARLCDWIKNEAGSANPEYLNTVKDGLGLDLLQVPEEYAKLLLWFKSHKFKNYLELGVGQGGSFLLDIFFQPCLLNATAVDNTTHSTIPNQKELIRNKIRWLHKNTSTSCTFFNCTTDSYFELFQESGELIKESKFDCIFIDADHSYEGAKRDYENSLKHINKGGYIIFHDINCRVCPDVELLWNEVKKDDSISFVHNDCCGIGIVQV